MNSMTRYFIAGLMYASSSLAVQAQSSCYQNPSLEGPSAPHVVPAPWQACYGSPDTQPGQWGITLPPSNGTSYVSFLHSGWANNGYNEGMTQLLTPCMVAGQTYSFTVDLAHTNIYTTADPNGCYSSLAVYGGNTACAQTETLWLSGVIMNTNWQQYTITFTPTGNWCYLSFSPYFINVCGTTGFDYINVMMDNISCIAPANATVGGTDATCNGTCNGTAWAAPTNGTPPFTYSWAPGGLTTDTITNLCAGTYTVTITDANNQTAVDSVTIVEPTPIVLQTTSTNVSCNGGNNGTGGVTASGGTTPFTYSWAPGGQTTSSITGLAAGAYIVTVSDSNSCPATATITITEPPTLIVTPGTAQTICNGLQAPITANASGGVGPYSYTWNPGNLNGASQNVQPSTTTTYTVTATDANNCTAVDSVLVTVNPLPVPAFTSNTQSGCKPLDVTFTDLSTVSSGTITSWLWDFGDGTGTSNAQNPTHQYGVSGAYTVKLTVTTAAGCSQTLTMVNYITVFPSPTASFTASPQPTTILDATISFTDLSVIPAQWQWDFGDPLDANNTSTLQHPTHFYGDTGTYCVKLVVHSANGCVDSTVNCIVIAPEFTFFAPNAFTPNGDGKNEVFYGYGTFIEEFEMWVFDRWGNMIFRSNDLYKGWDGKLKGELCQEDVYVWKVVLTDVNGKKRRYVGHVSLIK